MIIKSFIHKISSIIITLIIWIYFTLGFLVFFSPFYLLSYIIFKNRETSFQRLNHIFCRIFFLIIRILVPCHKWIIDKEIKHIKSSIIISNHLSYLDPLLLISLIKKQKTVVKANFFDIPIFGNMLNLFGYLPSNSSGKYSKIMIYNLEKMHEYLSSGGNLFIFPEGTRSKDGKINNLNKGVFKIAKMCKSAIKILYIKNTNILFEPGKFLFNTNITNSISIEIIAEILPDYENEKFSISQLMEQVKSLLEKKNHESSFNINAGCNTNCGA